MKTINRGFYVLIISNDPGDVFTLFRANELHGMTPDEYRAQKDGNTGVLYAGWTNYTPAEYERITGVKMYVYINAGRIRTMLELCRFIFAQLMQIGLHKCGITGEAIHYADDETAAVFPYVWRERSLSG